MIEIVHPARELFSRAKALALGRCHPVQRGEAVQPFFIVGAGRSGTTLLRRILQANPAVHIPPESHALRESIRVYRRNATLPWPELVRTTLASFEFDPGFERYDLSLRALARELAHVPPGRRSLATILDALYRRHAASLGRPRARWGDKTPLNAFALDEIHAVFPRARFVHLLRDGVDVARSYVEAGLLPDLAAAGVRWRDAVRAVRRFAARHPASCTELRYEAVVTDPVPTVASLCAFLGLPFDPARIDARDHAVAMPDVAHYAHLANVFDPIVDARIGAGRSALSGAERRRLAAVIGADLARMGYPPP